MYPNKYCSSDFVFVKNLVDEFARQGHECYVICPFSITHYKHFTRAKDYYWVEGNKVTMIQPNYISLSTFKIGAFYPTKILSSLAARKAFKQLKSIKPDIIYCHFWKQGLEAYPYAKEMKIPLFVASGECEIFMDNKDGHLNDFKRYVSGVICVSTKNKDESIEHNLTDPEKCFVAPNSIDNTLFEKLDKNECRQKLGLPKDKFIIAFVGWFAERKGCMKLSEAISRCSDDIYSLFIGSGAQIPSCNNILFKGKVKHDELPLYLNSADVFVLPTLQEGCCNSVVEAMACGLPIISSNLPFNWDVLSDDNSIMINPTNVEEIKNAILKLKSNSDLMNSMSICSLSKAKSLTISERAKNIIEFIQRKMSIC